MFTTRSAPHLYSLLFTAYQPYGIRHSQVCLSFRTNLQESVAHEALTYLYGGAPQVPCFDVGCFELNHLARAVPNFKLPAVARVVNLTHSRLHALYTYRRQQTMVSVNCREITSNSRRRATKTVASTLPREEHQIVKLMLSSTGREQEKKGGEGKMLGWPAISYQRA